MEEIIFESTSEYLRLLRKKKKENVDTDLAIQADIDLK